MKLLGCCRVGGAQIETERGLWMLAANRGTTYDPTCREHIKSLQSRLSVPTFRYID